MTDLGRSFPSLGIPRKWLGLVATQSSDPLGHYSSRGHPGPGQMEGGGRQYRSSLEPSGSFPGDTEEYLLNECMATCPLVGVIFTDCGSEFQRASPPRPTSGSGPMPSNSQGPSLMKLLLSGEDSHTRSLVLSLPVQPLTCQSSVRRDF